MLNLFRSPSRGVAAGENGQPSLAARIARHSTGLQEFSRHIVGREGLSILDLGPTSPKNIQYITTLGHKVYNEDVLAAAADPGLLKPGEDGAAVLDVERFFAENLLFRGHQFDAVLCWDVADYLHESLVKPMMERIHSVLKPGGVLLGFFVYGTGYLALGFLQHAPAAYAVVVLSHTGGAMVWVFSTTMLQLMSDDKFRGRVFSAELSFCTVMLAATAYAAGFAIDHGIDVRVVAMVTGALTIFSGLVWLLMGMSKGSEQQALGTEY